MLHLNCQCEESIEIPESFIGESTPCASCGKPLRAIAGGPLGSAQEITARLSIIAAPTRTGEQLFLAGKAPIEIGKLPEKHLSLQGTMVSRNHCRLIPADGGWRIEDLKSTNGIFVNRKRVQASILCEGDILRVGEYEMHFSRANGSGAPAADDVSEPILAEIEDPWAEDIGAYDIAEVESTGAILPSAPPPVAAAAALPAEPLRPPGSGPVCPCCEKILAPKAKLCISCGIKVPSGRPIITSRGMDEDGLVERTRAWINLISLFLPLNLLPVASEAFGTKKARSVWIIFGVTMLASALFLIANWGETTHLEYTNFMLWTGSNDVAVRKWEAAHHQLQQIVTNAEKARKKGSGLSYSPDAELTDEEIKELRNELNSQTPPVPQGEFHAYQLLTHALLHGGIVHFAGNMVFLLVFGLRVNELIGDLKFAIVYPLLAIAAALSYMASTSGHALQPMLGASGAVMGLAGMYFVLFPIQRVHMVFWIRFGLWAFYLKMFRMRGFWLLVLWIGFNDILPMYFHSRGDHVAHWAHIGGFLFGMAIAIGLLIGRQATARGGDLLSVLLGRHAWPMLGKPNQNLEAPIASPKSGRRIVYAGPM